MRIIRIGKVKNISLETAVSLSSTLIKDGYRTEIVETDLGDGFEILVYEERKRRKRWWCYFKW